MNRKDAVEVDSPVTLIGGVKGDRTGVHSGGTVEESNRPGGVRLLPVTLDVVQGNGTVQVNQNVAVLALNAGVLKGQGLRFVSPGSILTQVERVESKGLVKTDLPPRG